MSKSSPALRRMTIRFAIFCLAGNFFRNIFMWTLLVDILVPTFWYRIYSCFYKFQRFYQSLAMKSDDQRNKQLSS